MTAKRTALLSVSDKTGIAELACALAENGWRLLSTGGTARTLSLAGIPVIEVSSQTGFPEIMDGRVKTLHPMIHGGLLGRRGTDDAIMAEHGIDAIDLLVVNLYPFAQTAARPDCTVDEAIEQIDVGGPAMLRAAAKNHASVCVLCDPADYATTIGDLPDLPDAGRRRALAVKAFAHTAAYDSQISQWLAAQAQTGGLPPLLNLHLEQDQTLRYGENPHQAASLFRERGAAAAGLAGAQPLQGKAMSYNNLLDADAAWRAISTLGVEQPACVIVKHGNPCGAALGDDLEIAYDRALACDPTSAFGGIIAFNRELDETVARRVIERFVEVVLAPAASSAAKAVFQSKPNLRLLAPQPATPASLEIRGIDGGWLVQETDHDEADESAWRVATRRQPTAEEMADLRFAWSVARTVRSNAIVYARDQATIGIGAGQMSRVDSARIGAWKAADAGLELRGGAMASDAFFPFADSIETAAEHGIRTVIQPGGSMRDAEVIAACDHHDIAMILTGRRHFKH
ncbi:bifunctional phosphoribosylaminoimidazolecarboxamide formyltransferase/IMP cyclohydrolase [Wenzhouxiangella limi]|uniref:Bifunctional purine biosynthesis protein PurH n=1 Tax=Wenzhouxiangella limi TaxID=2707351 RepID=A0A845UYQ7_9GAMM|nr:bifunctional phosphoribosylaminoimidazolecarboxamide formyltransferase/IMP cyclohydrolase [Wenzhouxiangella limi]NDY94216.1 bifunctional phosphoribosylaminoimidazolecarboxamide formyltransferase/IMP cyclohydrolase [Wenzhouxiangella limi]